MLDAVEVARLGEARLARGTAEVATEHIEVGGGVACWSGPRAQTAALPSACPGARSGQCLATLAGR